MCRDISFHSEIQVITETFPEIKLSGIDQASKDAWAHVTCEILPEYPIVAPKNEELYLTPMSWGVIPAYEKDPKMREIRRRNMVNAQSERILEDKKSYWYRLRKNRCLIPATGVYEHRKVAGFKNKIPYLVKPEGRNGFYLPALYQISEEVNQSTGEIFNVASFTMITRKANELMEWIHNDGDNKHRMPLFLAPELEKTWLDPALSDDDIRAIFQYRIASDELYHHPVFTIRGAKAIRDDEKTKDEFYDWGEKLPVYGKGSGGGAGVGQQGSLF
ncbi:SOS response-associated peptidase [Desertivirga brevis]|uniref:SOS response-associated peptidase n=1 Tax=Desertivirga brevis TaxID=2810310 RepID=UPI001A960156|nr:SOS response-associated peptidase family protein [Pedobacter sp. SYSU D00873]